MHPFKRDEIVILLGAGASVDAGIPHSQRMVEEIEKLLVDGKSWAKYKRLYDYIKSSIFYSDGIRGNFDNKVNFNIERLVNTLEEVSKKREHTLYPFVGSWNPTLVEVAGNDFEMLSQLRDQIVNILRQKWIVLKDHTQANYFQKLEEFQKEYQHPLRVFTLNYDLCVEKNCTEIAPERGFNDQRLWDWREYEDVGEPKHIYLYKLHGSTDWHYENDILTFSDEPGAIDNKDAAIIFGSTYKLQYRDPFLFLAYEFRKWTLTSRIIIAIGYGFGDEHINRIIFQALNNDKNRILLSVSPLRINSEPSIQEKVAEIETALGLKNGAQIKVCSLQAKNFMVANLNLGFLADLLPKEEGELFHEVLER